MCTLERQGEPWRNCLREHETVVKKNDLKNGIAVHAWANQHQINWEAGSVKQEEEATGEEGS